MYLSLELDPCGQDSNLAKTQFGTQTHDLLIRITYLVSGLRFFVSQHGKNSVTDKVIGKKWIYLERNTPHRVRAILEGKRPWNMAWLVFMGWVTSQANEWKDYFNYFGKGEEISRHWAAAHFSAFHGAGGHHGVTYPGDGLQWVHMRLMVCASCLVTQWCPTLWPHGLQPARLLHPWDFPGKNTRGGCHALLQGIFPTQGSNSGILHCRQVLYKEAQGSRSSGSQLIYCFGPIWF